MPIAPAILPVGAMPAQPQMWLNQHSGPRDASAMKPAWPRKEPPVPMVSPLGDRPLRLGGSNRWCWRRRPARAGDRKAPVPEIGTLSRAGCLRGSIASWENEKAIDYRLCDRRRSDVGDHRVRGPLQPRRASAGGRAGRRRHRSRNRCDRRRRPGCWYWCSGWWGRGCHCGCRHDTSASPSPLLSSSRRQSFLLSRSEARDPGSPVSGS